MTADEIVEELEGKGFRLRTVGDRLRIHPPVPADLLERMRGERDAVFRLVQAREGRVRPSVGLAGLRRFCPGLWTGVRLEDGSEAMLWGVTGRGVIVSRSPSSVLLTLAPEDVAGFCE